MATFVSAILNEVQHPVNVLKEYLEVFNKVNKCKAAILSWLDGWTKAKKAEGEIWVWIVTEDLAIELGYCRETIQRHLKELVSGGLLEKRKAKRWPTDQAWAYKLNFDEIRKTVGYCTKAFEKNPTLESEKSDTGLPDILQSSARNTPHNISSSIESFLNSDTTPKPDEGGEMCEEVWREEEIRAVIADAPFMEDGDQESQSVECSSDKEKFSAAVARDFLERLRNLDVPLTFEVRSLVAATPEAKLTRNVSALEEEAATKGLKSPIAAFKHFVKNNCQPRDERCSWLRRAAAALGDQHKLIQAVTEYAGAIRVFFTNGRSITLAQAQGMTWEEIAALGETS